MSRRRLVLMAVGGAAGVLLIFGAFTGGRAWWAWRSIERFEFDLTEAREAVSTPDDASDQGTATQPSSRGGPALDPISTTAYDTVLVIGSDERIEGYTKNREGPFADVILYYLAPRDGGAPLLVSLPRDLEIADPCTGGTTILASTFAGCGELISGAELVALAVEDYTGVPVDHFGIVNFDGLVGVVDAVGGVTICVQYALRETTTDLLPEGCSAADGATALAWIRSRQTQEYVEGEWRFVEGISDLSRIQRQQELLFALLAKLKTMRSPTALTAVVTDLGDALQLDEGFSLGEAIGMAWQLRGTSTADFRQLTVPVEAFVTDEGIFMARPTMTFSELIDTG